ncbi:Eco57I restriction-modification methylase domain-containing protein [Lentibacillus salicampi]|nr:TaqI-like C-terminal specificity domain-containing protein [Lentibacillus salicampi]
MQHYIFNRKQISDGLKHDKLENIPDFERKQQIVANWHYSLTQSDLEKTKEEAVQGDFLTQIFSYILGYKGRFGKRFWNLQQEQKAIMDGTKADGALGYFSGSVCDTRVAIELKDAKTDLDRKQNRANNESPVEQAFSYQYKYKNCRWVIVSNFKEIRLYHASTMTEYEQFFMRDLKEDDQTFRKFCFLLSKEHLIDHDGRSKIDILYDNNEKEEAHISHAFYRDYQKVSTELFSHLCEQNNHLDELVIFGKTQKILDRFIFMCFCEDTGLLPRHEFREVVQAARHSFDMSSTKIWNQLKGLFHSINQGNPERHINRFNGGLFKTDDVLDQLVILDDIFPLFEKITAYDFSTELNVNILGHIFEQSINDIEEIKSEITDSAFDAEQGKRKKDGIFYTSPGVTKFLLQETLLNWIDDRKQELHEADLPNLTEKDFETYRKTKPDKRRKKLLPVEQHIDFYRKLQERLRSIKILDPAVGSGAFLNTAFDYLIQEGDKINKKLEEMQEGQAELFDINRYILNHNLFGVDLNKESVEISKLSLWLKTANKQDELTSLDDNLKTGNSLISQQGVSEKAFDWQQEFPEAMDDGGFDIVIGNPPYVFARGKGFSDDEKAYFNIHYELAEYQMNTYLLFIERSYHLLKEGGWFAFIVPNTCLTIDSFKRMRRFLLKNTGNLKIINIYDRMFAEADVDTCFIIFQKATPTTVKLGEYVNEHVDIVADVEPDELLDEQSIINISLMKNKQTVDVMRKIEKRHLDLGSVATVKSGLVAYEVGRGAPVQTKDMKDNRVYHSDQQMDDTYWRYLDGRDVCRYYIDWRGNWLKYGPNLAAKRREQIFTVPRILVRQIPSKSTYAINAVYTEKEILNDRNSNNIIDFQKDPLFLLGVMNSKVITFWFINKFDKFQRKTFPQFKVKDLKMFPIPDVSEQEEKQITDAVSQMLELQRDKSQVLHTMEKVVLHELKIDQLPVRFQSFYEWDADERLAQIDGLRRVSLTEKNDWLAYFQDRKGIMVQLTEKEAELNEKIDQYTADAFGLSADEIKLIEENLREFQE